MSQKEISEYLDVTEATVSKWKTAGEWDKMKAAKGLTKDTIIKNLYEEALSIQNKARDDKRNLNSKEMDVIMKIAASIEKMDRKFNLPTVIGVFKEFNIWLVNVNPELAKSVTEFQRKFIYQLSTGNE